MYIFIRSSRRSKEGCGSAPRDSRRMLEDEAVAGEWPRRITRHEQTRLLIVLTKILYAPRDIVCTKRHSMHQDTVCTKRLSQDPTSSMFIQSRAAQWQPSFETVLRDSLERQSCETVLRRSTADLLRTARTTYPQYKSKIQKNQRRAFHFLGLSCGNAHLN